MSQGNFIQFGAYNLAISSKPSRESASEGTPGQHTGQAFLLSSVHERWKPEMPKIRIARSNQVLAGR